MKRVILLLLPLFLLSFAFAETTIHTIGDGDLTSSNAPYVSSSKYSKTGCIYSAAELNALGAGSITKIAYNVNNAISRDFGNQKIYMRHTGSDYYNKNGSTFNLGTNYMDGYQLVFEGSLNYNSAGWKTITLSTPFEYNGTSGIEIFYDNAANIGFVGVNFKGTRYYDGTLSIYPVFYKTFTDEEAYNIFDGAVTPFYIRPNLQLTITKAPTYDIMPGVAKEFKDAADQEIATVTITGDDFAGANISAGYTLTPIPNANFTPALHTALNMVGTGSATISITTDAEWFAYVQGGEWQAFAGPLTNKPITVSLGTKNADFEFALGAGDNPTLPVELSMFNATYNDQVNQVELIWRTETETQMSGYRVFRSTNDKLADALIISPALINATNTSGAHLYRFVDTDIADGIYYYWLEAVGYTSSDFFGPLSVTVEIDDSYPIPEVPIFTKLGTAYPNPFNPSTTISYDLKDPTPVRLDILNLKGQIVRTLVNEAQADGNYHVHFNGKDNLGNELSSGVYLYRLQAGSYQDSRKMILMK